MKQEGLRHFTDLYLTSMGLLVFFVFFVCMVVWIMSKKRAPYVEYMRELPLSEGEDHGRG